MGTEVMAPTSTGLMALGLLLLLMVGLAERKYGDPAAAGVVIAGLVFEVLAVALGIASLETLGSLSAGASAVVLAWTGTVYVVYRTKKVPSPPSSRSGSTCVPVLILGQYTIFTPLKETWRTHLKSQFFCNPGNSSMPQSAWAFGKAYYGLWLTWGTALAEPTIDITCEKKDDKCFATASEVGAIEDITGCTRVYIKNVIAASGDTVTVVTKMGSALNASGGPSVTVTAGPVGITMSFPDASLSSVYAMGTYRWQCRRERASTD